MNRSEMHNLVTATIARHMNVLEQRVTEDSSLIDDLGTDSLDIIELGMEFEEMFKIELPDSDLEQLTTVGETIDLMLRKVNENMIDDNEQKQTPVQDDDAAKQPDDADHADHANEGDAGDDEGNDPEED